MCQGSSSRNALVMGDHLPGLWQACASRTMSSQAGIRSNAFNGMRRPAQQCFRLRPCICQTQLILNSHRGLSYPVPVPLCSRHICAAADPVCFCLAAPNGDACCLSDCGMLLVSSAGTVAGLAVLYIGQVKHTVTSQGAGRVPCLCSAAAVLQMHAPVEGPAR
jgi:hypothetical protein